MKFSTRRIALAVVLAPLFILLVAADKPDPTESIRKAAQSCADALLKADYTAFVEFTHPKVISMVGGKDKMIEMVKTGVEDLKKQNLAIVSYKIESPGAPVAAGSDLASVVPTVLQMTHGSEKITQKSYLLAISSDKGEHWTFVDGAGLDEEKVKLVLADAPKELKLPAKTDPVIEKK